MAVRGVTGVTRHGVAGSGSCLSGRHALTNWGGRIEECGRLQSIGDFRESQPEVAAHSTLEYPTAGNAPQQGSP